jgi:Zn-dependent alcohol dehydrogenase
MIAVVYHGPDDIRIETVPIPENNRNELLVKVDACAVCGTDLKSFRSGNPRIQAPIVMGHEFTGIVLWPLLFHAGSVIIAIKVGKICVRILHLWDIPSPGGWLNT